MLTTNFASGFGSNYNRVLPETVYPPFSQTLVFNTATAGTRIKLPNYVNTVRVYAWGAGGAGGGKGPGPILGPPAVGDARPGGTGGNGGFVQADFPVPAGAILYVRVGGGGAAGANSIVGGSGGGYSSVELPTSAGLDDYLRWLVIAGGGGGGGHGCFLNAPSPSPLNPSGGRSAGYNGGPAHTPGVGYGATPASLGGLAAPNSPWGPLSSFRTGQPIGLGGQYPIGGVYSPFFPTPIRPIYAPYTPNQGPSSVAEPGGFLSGGGGTGSGLTRPINNGGIGHSRLPGPQFPGTSFRPGPYIVQGAGGGGAGLSGGGAGHPVSLFGPVAPALGEAGGGGGRSYINPTGTNTSQANTGPYTPNPIFNTNYIAKPASSNTKAETASGGIGYVETSRTPDPAPYLGYYINAPDWLGQEGGDGLVVIVY